MKITTKGFTVRVQTREGSDFERHFPTLEMAHKYRQHVGRDRGYAAAIVAPKGSEKYL